MPKNSCVRHPEGDSFIMLRQTYLDITGGCKVAAALCSYFEFRHNAKLADLPEMNKKNAAQIKAGAPPLFREWYEPLLIYNTVAELEEAIKGIGKRDKIRSARELLIDLGIIEEYLNPNPRFKHDQTKFYLFNPERVNTLIWGTSDTTAKNRNCIKSATIAKNRKCNTIAKNRNSILRSPQVVRTIQEVQEGRAELSEVTNAHEKIFEKEEIRGGDSGFEGLPEGAGAGGEGERGKEKEKSSAKKEKESPPLPDPVGDQSLALLEWIEETILGASPDHLHRWEKKSKGFAARTPERFEIMASDFAIWFLTEKPGNWNQGEAFSLLGAQSLRFWFERSYIKNEDRIQKIRNAEESQLKRKETGPQNKWEKRAEIWEEIDKETAAAYWKAVNTLNNQA